MLAKKRPSVAGYLIARFIVHDLREPARSHLSLVR